MVIIKPTRTYKRYLAIHNTTQYANRAKEIKIKPGTAQLLSQEVPWHEVGRGVCACASTVWSPYPLAHH